jgi:hypothetical protein
VRDDGSPRLSPEIERLKRRLPELCRSVCSDQAQGSLPCLCRAPQPILDQPAVGFGARQRSRFGRIEQGCQMLWTRSTEAPPSSFPSIILLSSQRAANHTNTAKLIDTLGSQRRDPARPPFQHMCCHIRGGCRPVNCEPTDHLHVGRSENPSGVAGRVEFSKRPLAATPQPRFFCCCCSTQAKQDPTGKAGSQYVSEI